MRHPGLGLLALALVGCGGLGARSSEAPLVLLLAPEYDAGPARLAALGDALEAALGHPVEVRVTESGEEAVRTAGTPHWDAALLPLFDYLFCAQEFGVDAVLRVRRAGGGETYAGDLVVRGDSAVTDLSGLAGQPVAFVDRASTSGFVLPLALLVDAGVQVEPVFAGTHEAALAQLRAGSVAAAATFDSAVVGDESLRVLARTAEVPNEPVFVRHDLEPSLRAGLVAGLQAYAATEAGHLVLVEMAGIEGFAPTDDDAYEGARAVVEKAGVAVEDLVERGWGIANVNRRPMWSYEP